MKNKPNPSLPNAGPRPAVNRLTGEAKKQTSFPAGDGLDGKGGSKNGKDSANTRDAYRENNRPPEWKRKDRKSHADHKAAKVQGGSL